MGVGVRVDQAYARGAVKVIVRVGENRGRVIGFGRSVRWQFASCGRLSKTVGEHASGRRPLNAKPTQMANPKQVL